ncbi:glycerophosphodiester phosphodiesterase family protein [Pseudoalteromonas tunicata]|uniref:glycerophosphodiester phosphodiesterase n=1 Tax=Pseudoalteromonas tunicata TaxID=314281 RepID=UPI00273EC290|nr:glycerophosphodiester phosphodiesterase family protein [Pseudoalteromonas tunicata]MDP5212789.1 glycerophosphodiester phosphodiesterase family protein [Pseudoalteromonas tunicata]
MKIFAHRGASGNHPENTLKAIQAALEIGVDGIEVDVQSCLDDYVIIHDSWLDRTTNGVGKVHHTNLASIKTLDAGLGQSVPTLQELLQLNSNQTLLNLELKHTFELNKLVKILDLNIANKIISPDNLLISSFDHHQLKWMKQQLPWLKIGALTSSIPLHYATFAQELNAFSVHVDKDFVNADFVKDAHARGLEIYAYTVDKYEDVKKLHQLDIDGIFSNFPSNTKSFVQFTKLE